MIHAQQLCKYYQQGDTQITALEQIDLHIKASEFIAICGHSGSGKSTLLNIIGTLEQADAGKLRLWDTVISSQDQKKQQDLRQQRMGFIFQDFNLNPALTAEENVMIPLLLTNITRRERYQQAKDMLIAVGLGERRHHKPGQLSGGQQQRVAAARALVTKPDLILADEPTANLDTDSTEQLISVLKTLNNNQGTTIVFSTHDERLLKHVERQVILSDGHLQQQERLGEHNVSA